MAEQSQFWNTNGTGDGPGTGYTQADLNEFYRKVFNPDQDTTGGVLYHDQRLAVTVAAQTPSLQPGSAFIMGYLYENTTALSLGAIAIPAVGTTGGRIGLRINYAAQTVRAFNTRSADGTATPPALVQTANTTWEVSLYTYSITTGGVVTLTDTRAYARSGAVITAEQVKGGVSALLNLKRQGGSSTDWAVAGQSNFSTAAVRLTMQMGRVAIPTVSANGSQSIAITYPVAFTSVPIIFLQQSSSSYALQLGTQSETINGFTLIAGNYQGVAMSNYIANWIAYGHVAGTLL